MALGFSAFDYNIQILNDALRLTLATTFFLSSSILIAMMYSEIFLITCCTSLKSFLLIMAIKGILCNVVLKLSNAPWKSPLLVKSNPLASFYIRLLILIAT